MAPPSPPEAQTVRFCRSRDGVRIAYAAHGHGPPLVVSTCWLSHLEYDLESPVWQHWIGGVGRLSTMYRYDERGHGLSDWDVPGFSFESRVEDLEAVVDAAGLEQFALLGMAQGGPVAIAYALRHPERVTRLILHGSYAATVGRTPESRALEEMFTRLIQVGWARPEGRFRRVFTDMLMPGATEEQMSWVDALMPLSTSPENAVAFRLARLDLDVSDLLPRIDLPTLVLHARGDQMNPLAGGRHLAAAIPGARLVTLESDNHILMAQEPAWQVFLTELDRFLEPDRRALVADAHSAGSGRNGRADPRATRDGSGPARPVDTLTRREREVLALVAEGRDNTDIAAALTLSVRTVERHLQTIYRKLGLTGSAQRTAAAAFAHGTSAYAPTASAAR